MFSIARVSGLVNKETLYNKILAVIDMPCIFLRNLRERRIFYEQ